MESNWIPDLLYPKMIISKIFENLFRDRLVLEFAHMGGESGITDEPLLLELVHQHLVEHPQLPVPPSPPRRRGPCCQTCPSPSPQLGSCSSKASCLLLSPEPSSP